MKSRNQIYNEFNSNLTYDRNNLRWNGWGSYDEDYFNKENMPDILHFLRNELGVSEASFTPSVLMEEISLPESKLSPAEIKSLQSIVGKDRFFDSRLERILHSSGRSYHDVIRLHRNQLRSFVDCVVYPNSEKEIVRLLELSSSKKLTIIPYGGGSSVVGGLEPIASSPGSKIISIDMTKMNRLLELNEENLTARFESGIYGPHLEKILNSQGYTLGHFPQSFVYSTLGGWVASRSAGQNSNRYGKIEELISGMKLITPKGIIVTGNYPAHSAGSDWNQIIAGSEGLLGIITEVNLQIHRLPERRLYFGLIFPNFTVGKDFIREINQRGIETSMMRLSDEQETRLFSNLGSLGKKGIFHKILSTIQNKVLEYHNLKEIKSALIIGLEGREQSVYENYIEIREIGYKLGGFYIGESIGKNWIRNRFNLPFLRNHLIEFGLGVDTMETSTTYDNIDKVWNGFHKKIQESIPNSISLCHISHSYWNGACLYFTVIFKMDTKRPVEEWKRMKKVASDFFLANGASASHHHGIGVDHKLWYKKEMGEAAVDGLTAIKYCLDKNGILNPGKVYHSIRTSKST